MECDQLGDAPSDLVTTKFSSSRLNLNVCFVVAVQLDANACFVVLFAFSNPPSLYSMWRSSSLRRQLT